MRNNIYWCPKTFLVPLHACFPINISKNFIAFIFFLLFAVWMFRIFSSVWIECYFHLKLFERYNLFLIVRTPLRFGILNLKYNKIQPLDRPLPPFASLLTYQPSHYLQLWGTLCMEQCKLDQLFHFCFNIIVLKSRSTNMSNFSFTSPFT